MIGLICALASAALLTQSNGSTQPSFGDEDTVVTGTIQHLSLEFANRNGDGYFVVLDQPTDILGDPRARDATERDGLRGVERIMVRSSSTKVMENLTMNQTIRNSVDQRVRVTGELKIDSVTDGSPLVRSSVTSVVPAD